jgi:ubiquinone biosynthesis protein Coq4
MGRRLKAPLFYVRWEDYWDCQIAEIQEELGLTGGPAPGAWDWTLEVMRG